MTKQEETKWCPAHGYPLPCDKCGLRAVAREEIREGLLSKIKSIRNWSQSGVDPLSAEDDTGDILKYLHDNDVVIKGESLGVSHPHLANYFTFKPLIKEE